MQITFHLEPADIERFQRVAQAVAEGLEPGAGDFLAFGEFEVEGGGGGHGRA